MRFRLFDRVRRSREPESGHGTVADRTRGSGRHRLGAAGDRPRYPAETPGNGADRPGNFADRPATAADRRGIAGWRGRRTDRDLRGRTADWEPRAAAPRDPPGWSARDSWPGGAEHISPPAWAERVLRGRPAEPEFGGEPTPDRPGRVGPGGGPRAELPRAELPWTEPPRGELPWTEPPRGELPRAEPPRGELPPTELPRAQPPRRDAPRTPAPPGEATRGGARARVRGDLSYGAEPFTSPVRDKTSAGGVGRADTRRNPAGRGGRDATRRPWYQAGNPAAGVNAAARPAADSAWPAHLARTDGRARAGLPYTAPHRADELNYADGRRHCGSLERVLHRQWDVAAPPPAEIVRAIDRLAELPAALKEKLAAGLDGIFIGPGGVPDLDDMQHLRGVPLPAGRATWDVCAGAYGGRKIIVGAQPSPTPDVMCHEIGHALDDIDSPGQWLSDQAEFRTLYDQCVPHLVSDFHRQPGGLGRREFFADAFAAIASRQRPALVDMLGGDTRTALNVMLFFNRRYGI